MIKIKEKDLLFFGINIVLFLFLCAAQYIILHRISIIAVQYAVSEKFFIAAAIIVVLFDIWLAFRILDKANREYRRDTL